MLIFNLQSKADMAYAESKNNHSLDENQSQKILEID